MVTPRGTIKTDSKLYSQKIRFPFFQAGLDAIFIIAMISIIIISVQSDVMSGPARIITVIVLSVLSFLNLLCLGAETTAYQNYKKIQSECTKVNTYEFFADCVGMIQTENGKHTCSEVQSYAYFKQIRETDKLFILTAPDLSQYPVTKDGLDVKEINTLRAAFRLPYGGEIINLPPARLKVEPYTVIEETDAEQA